MAGFSIKHLFERAKQAMTLAPKRTPERPAAFVQVGFDFGTAFSKVVLRDVNVRRAWVYRPLPFPGQDQSLPFLIPSLLYAGKSDGGWSLSVTRDDVHTHEIPFPKLALLQSIQNPQETDILDGYRRIAAAEGINEAELVRGIVSLYLASVLSGVFRHLRESDMNFDFVKSDVASVCMAIPARDLADPALTYAFLSCLRRGYWFAVSGADTTKPILLRDLLSHLSNYHCDPNHERRCELYPEVSANMIGYTRSRAARLGIFQMVDVGAGTVDISFFSFVRHAGIPGLHNFSGIVEHCGSSQIERIAAKTLGRPSDLTLLARLRSIKEGNGSTRPTAAEREALQFAREEIGERLKRAVHISICEMQDKLVHWQQIHDTQMIFVGGGAGCSPYETAVFAKWDELGKAHKGKVGIPTPDLELATQHWHWFSRLTVAFGLSFDSTARPPLTVPAHYENVERADPEERPRAVSKDEV